MITLLSVFLVITGILCAATGITASVMWKKSGRKKIVMDVLKIGGMAEAAVALLFLALTIVNF